MLDLAVVIHRIINARITAQQSPLPILYEDNHLLIVEKYPFVLSQPDGSQKLDALSLEKAYIRQRSLNSEHPKLGNVYLSACHRLDYTVGGILLLAKTDKSASRLQTAWAKGQINKYYIAISSANDPALSKLAKYTIPVDNSLFANEKSVSRKLNSNDHVYRLQDYICKDAVKLQAKVWQQNNTKAPDDYKEAILQMRLLAKYESAYIWQIALETGRFHQIRAQLAKAGFALLGDYKYNLSSAMSSDFSQPLLWSYALEFAHPVKKDKIKIQAWPEECCFYKFAQFPYADYLS